MASSVTMAEFRQKLKKLECPYLSDMDASSDLEAILFMKGGSARQELLWWLFGKLDVVLQRNPMLDPFIVLFDSAVKNGFCSKKDEDLITGAAPMKKQAMFLTALLDLAILNNSKHIMATNKLSGNLDWLKSENIIPAELLLKLDRMEKITTEISNDALKEKIKALEDELKEKETKLTALPDITPPTKEQYLRLQSVMVELDKVSKKFLKSYKEQMAIWCKSMGDVSKELPAESSRLGVLCERVNDSLDELIRVFVDVKAIQTFNSVDIPKLRTQTLQLKEKLNSKSSQDMLGANNIQTIDEMTSIFELAVGVMTTGKRATEKPGCPR